jgi:hypothetical protein
MRQMRRTSAQREGWVGWRVGPGVPWDGGCMKLEALVQKPENIARFLKHLGEPTEPPPLAPASCGG